MDITERIERIRALNDLLQLLRIHSIRAHRAMKAALTAAAFNGAVRLAQEIDDQIEKHRNELFDLIEA